MSAHLDHFGLSVEPFSKEIADHCYCASRLT